MLTQLRATPPARQALRSPVVSRAWRAIRSTISSVTTWIDRAMSISRLVSSLSGGRAGAPKSLSNFAFVIFRLER